MNQKSWTKAVDGTTVLWLAIFFVGIFSFDSDLFGLEEPLIDFPQDLKNPWEIVSWIIWGVLLVDVIFKYRASENWKEFFRKHWFDILLLIPFFRILRIMRLLRLLKVAKVGFGGYKTYKKSKN